MLQEVIKTLSVVGLILAGLGTAGVVADTVVHLVQSGLIGRVWLTLLSLSLLALGGLVLTVGAYLSQQVRFTYFAVLMISVLTLISAAFRILGRLGGSI